MKTGVTILPTNCQQVRTRAKQEPQQQRQAWERVERQPTIPQLA
jgi:hypothetical protein